MSEFTHVCSTDAGNGGVNTCVLKVGQKPTSPTFDYFPSVRAVVRGKSLGLDANLEHQYSKVDWNGQSYIVGDDCTRVSRQGIDHYIGQDRYGSEHHQFLVMTALARVGVGLKTPANVALSLFCPPEYFSDQKETIRRAFEGKTYRFSYADKPHIITVGKVFVIPEGQAAMFCFNLNPDGSPNQNNPLYGDVLFLDSGVFTLDCVLVRDGKVASESTFSLPNAGLNQFIRVPLMLAAQSAGRDFQNVSEDDIDQLIRAYAIAKDDSERVEACILYHGGYTVDLYSQMQNCIATYVNWIVSNALSRFDGLRGVKNVVLVGGGASLITEYLSELYPDKIKNSSTPPHYAAGKVHPVNANVVGGLRVALARIG
ncbi:MAG: hypothetical protein BroJett018_54920 [Chloroflexota bacterium]|nr:MAG: hypothetical protein BroJett018_54920 [Chloroflexota bacterium]